MSVRPRRCACCEIVDDGARGRRCVECGWREPGYDSPTERLWPDEQPSLFDLEAIEPADDLRAAS